jgi:hypothetical protein
MLRLSINSYTSLDDPDANPNSKRRAGFVREAGLQIGTHNSVTVFVAVGPSWSF